MNFAEINRRFEAQCLAFVREKHLEKDCLTYFLESWPSFVSDIFDDLARPYASNLPVLMARLYVLDPFDNNQTFRDFAEYIGWEFDDLFNLIVDGIEPNRIA